MTQNLSKLQNSKVIETELQKAGLTSKSQACHRSCHVCHVTEDRHDIPNTQDRNKRESSDVDL